jgi:ectoine hydroxylase-related dioxygenase (phytanoyl-CoA dioxygenase family)
MQSAPCYSLLSPALEPSDGRSEYQSKLLAEMKKNGVVRIDNVLTEEMTASLLSLVMHELEVAKADVAKGVDQSKRFSNLLSSENRWDLKLPWSPTLADAYRRIVRPGMPLGDLLTNLASNNGSVHELAAFVSMPGACRQVLHADTLWSATPSVYTCTVALQDVTPAMGPTVFLPATQSRAAHRRFDAAASRRALIAAAPHALSTLAAGDAAVYDSRVLHCGGANRSARPRVLLYLSLLDPAGPLATGRGDVANVATIRPELAGRLTLASLRRPPS